MPSQAAWGQLPRRIVPWALLYWAERCLLRGVSENSLGQVLTWNQDGSRRLNSTGYTRLSSYPQPVSEQGRLAVPREKTTKITVTPESFLVSGAAGCWLLLPLGNGLAFGRQIFISIFSEKRYKIQCITRGTGQTSVLPVHVVWPPHGDSNATGQAAAVDSILSLLGSLHQARPPAVSKQLPEVCPARNK